TNDDQQAYITVVKDVINNNGGSANPDDFLLTLDLGAVTSGVAVPVNPGTYNADETLLSGYTFLGYSDDCDSNGDTTVALGESKTCTLTNNDDPPSLTLIKVVINDDGGKAVPGDWTLTAAGYDATNPQTGTYDLSEDGPAHYKQTSLTCDDDPFTKVTSVTLGLGEHITCTFVNDDIAPSLKLIKVVVNGSNPGGTAVPDDWTLSAEAAVPYDGRNFNNPGGQGVPEIVFANAGYALSETADDDFVASVWSCEGGGSLVGSSITLGLNEDVICTITNSAKGMVNLLKLTNGVEDPEMEWKFTLSGPGVDETDYTPPPLVDFGGAKLIPGEEYTICETGIPAAWKTEWMVDTTGNGIPDAIIPMVYEVDYDPVGPNGYSRVYDPNYEPPPAIYTNDTRCVNFVIDVGETLNFQIDNQYLGGEPRTIGYWKNWNTCTGGGQADTAAENGGPAEGWYILDDVLYNPPGMTVGTYTFPLEDPGCEEGVAVLNKSDINTGEKFAEDAAYNLAAQLVAANANLAVGAQTCEAVVNTVADAQALLVSIGFDGRGGYLRPVGYDKDTYDYANALAEILDFYNNGLLCNGGFDPPPLLVPPTVSIISPTDGSDVTGINPVIITANAEDSDGTVVQVEFFVNSTSIIIDTDNSDGWSAAWDLTGLPDGEYAIEAVATDNDSKVAASVMIFVTIAYDDPPTVSITSPIDGAIISYASVEITADAVDDYGLTQVEFFVDGTSIGTDTDSSDGWSVTWDLTGVADGDYTISATATDNGANTASDSISVTVKADIPLAVIDLTGISSWVNKVKWEVDVTITLDHEINGVVYFMASGENSIYIGSCELVSSNQCTVTIDRISNKIDSVIFNIESIAAFGYYYTGPASASFERPD
ncbi:MAG: Ig-like domain-containing protein, partial [Chloroflexota bacterium]